MSIHKLITPQEILRLHEKWNNLYKENKDNGDLIASFVAGDQWDSTVRADRKKDGKEVLTLNITQKHRNRVIADYQSINYTLKVKPKVVKSADHIKNVNELLDHYVLKNNHEETAQAFEIGYTRGYTALKIVADYVNQFSYQLIPFIKHVKPWRVFFDCDAESLTKSDGRFAGEVNFVNEYTLKTLYPKYKIKESRYNTEIFGDNNRVKVYDFFFKEEQKTKFYKIGTKFKSEDQLTEYEKKNLGNSEYFEKLVTKIYACKCTEHEFLVKPHEFYGIQKLPYYFIGEAIPIQKESVYKEYILPPLSPLIDAQQMLNNAASQISTQATKKIERSVIIDKCSIDEIDMNSWGNFNVKAGAFPWKGFNEMGQQNVPPVVLEPSNLDTSLLQLMQISKVMIDEVMGINLSQQGSDEDNTQSGVALAQRIAQGDIVQKRFLYIFINALNEVGEGVKEMLAALVKDEYEFMLNGRMVKVNELAPSSLPDAVVKKGSLEKLHEEYDFIIEASPSSHLEKMRSRETLFKIGQSFKEYAPYFIDILFENLDINNSTELVERFKTMVDPVLRAVGKGEISEEEYYKIMNKRAEQQQKNQVDPATQLVQLEAQKIQTNAQLKSKELDQNFILEKDKLVLKQAELLADEKSDKNKDAIKILEMQTRNLDKRINARG